MEWKDRIRNIEKMGGPNIHKKLEGPKSHIINNRGNRCAIKPKKLYYIICMHVFNLLSGEILYHSFNKV